MRTPEFRYFYSGKMYEVGQIEFFTDGTIHVNGELVGGTLLEFTGLKDRNGVKIFERDVVKSGNGRIWEVKHGHYLVKDLNQYIEMYGWFISGDGCYLPLHEGLEVIGNELEHPHLLNKDVKKER